MSFIERILGGDLARAAAAWTNATALDAAITAAIKGFNTVVVTLRSTSTITGGAIVFEVSDDNANWYPITARRLNAFITEGSYTLSANDTKTWRIDVTGFTHFRIRLNPVITGTGTVNLGVTAQMMPTKTEFIVGGDVAHDGVDTGSNPVKIGSRAIAHGANPSAVAVGDRADQLANRAGVPFFIGGHPNIVSKSTRVTAGQTNLDIIGAIGAGTKVVVTQLIIGVSKATTVNVGVKVGFGAASIPADGTAVTGVIFDHDGIEPGSGAVVGDGSAIIGVGGDGEELRLTNDAPTTGSLIVTVKYYTIES